MIVDVIIAAAGQGRRMGGSVAKQWRTLGDRTLFEWSVQACAAPSRVRGIVVVAPAADVAGAAHLARLRAGGKLLAVVEGGARRQDSVARGIAALPAGADVVLVHDAARPFVTTDVIDRVIDAAAESGAAIAAAAVHDTVKRFSGDEEGRWVSGTVPRDALAFAQTPQGFRRDVLTALHAAMSSPAEATDEASLAEHLGYRVRLVDGHAANVKITTEDDLANARAMHLARSATPDTRTMRIGLGYDSHRFADDRRLVLGGVHVPDTRGLAGHSDGDAVCHAVADAILGAAGLGDIGGLFPDTDPAWKDADSVGLLRQAFARVQEAGWRVGNLDVVVICQQPKIGPIAPLMRESLAGALDCEPARISVKGKTPEGTPALGRALVVHAVALLERGSD